MSTINMRIICCILICLMSVSCKQGIFLKRKYTDGFYFSKAGSVHLKEIHQAKTNNTSVTFSKEIQNIKPLEPLTDTIILTSGKKLPCKVKVIQRKSITYTDGRSGPTGPNKIIKNKKVARIHFKEGQKEYFTQYHSNANPILQFDHIRTRPLPGVGMAFFGYVLIVITGLSLVVAQVFFGFFFLLLAFAALIILSSPNYESLAYKITRGFGKFIGILFLAGLGTLLLILIIALAAFA